MTRVDVLERVVAPVVEAAGLELVDLERGPGRVKVTVDRADGVDLDVLSAVTARISRELDQRAAVPGGSYELEVSSPGVERRLRRPDHFRRFVGEEVSVRTKSGTAGERRVSGRLVSAGADNFTIEGDDIPENRRTISYSDVERAHTVFDWRAALSGTSAPSARRDHRHESRQKHQKSARQPTAGSGQEQPE